ncbi:hypothetical protein CCC_03123 [Paramagnetospirillum magnetotacticum MS-1]|uniref:Phage-like element PBSX protein XkdF domain-containing protein n=1 Tax=Paramagnetospirillum magnetotacticum MS-1 TaxID=272627 RepID=A0A0C2Z0U2_PARME|nr:XkdF-like putative serine protease domain-containing protein [Paramagnetospirillum magnetotacticum]KIM00521.1 hypothetical protein CCC_03123 [Paramagnetospirillum magnetotacticum MS-1]
MAAATIAMTAPITKTDAAERLVFGWASVIEENGQPVVDRQGDVITEAELEKAAYDFAENARAAGEMHTNIGVGELVESVVLTKQKQQAMGIDLGRVGWWIGFRVTPDVFEKVASGVYRAFSIGGTGQRVAINQSEINTMTAKSFGEVLAKKHRVRTAGAPRTPQSAPKAMTTPQTPSAPLAPPESPLIKTEMAEAARVSGKPQNGTGDVVGKVAEPPLIRAAMAAAAAARR